MTRWKRILARVGFCLCSMVGTLAAAYGLQQPPSNTKAEYEAPKVKRQVLTPTNNKSTWEAAAVLAFKDQRPLYVVLEGPDVTSAITFQCTYFSDGLSDNTSGKIVAWDVNVSGGNIRTRSDGNERVALDITPNAASLAPTGTNPGGVIGPVGSGVIVVQGRTSTGAVLGEARIRTWFIP
jgi:hypothetical protein